MFPGKVPGSKGLQGGGVGMLRGIQKIDKEGQELTENNINSPRVILTNRK